MNIRDFKLERYFAKHEFSAKYMLSSSDCDGLGMEYVLQNADNQELDMWNSLKLGYTESSGNPYLRGKIASMYNSISEDDIVVATPGELSFITMNLLVGPGDHAIVISPSYQSLYEVIRSLGCDISFWKPEPDTWRFDVGELEKLVRPNTRLIVINFPHNPTGSYLSIDELLEIVEIARRRDIWLYSDEMYRGLIIEEGLKELPAVCDIYQKGISLWGMAKSFALAGLRIGWIACRDHDFLHSLVSFKDYLSICNSAPSEILAAIALGRPELYIGPNIAKIKKNLAMFTEFVRTGPFLPFTPPRAGSIAFVPINYPGTSLEFSDRLVEKTGVMTIPAEMFEYEGKYLRIGFGRECMPDALKLCKNI